MNAAACYLKYRLIEKGVDYWLFVLTLLVIVLIIVEGELLNISQAIWLPRMGIRTRQPKLV